MMNEKLLAQIEIWTGILKDFDQWTDFDDKLLAQLRAMLQGPDDEEREEMIDIFNRMERISQGIYSSIVPNSLSIAEEYRPTLNKIRALIMAKRTVTLTREQFNLLAGELSATFFSIDHPQVAIDWLEPRLRSLGISIDDKGDVPVINEEGFSNEDRPFKKEKETKHD